MPFFKKFCFNYIIWMIKAKQVLSELLIQKITVSMVTKLPFCILNQNIIHCLCCRKNFIFLKSVEYIKSYRHFNVRCWKRWIQISSTEKTPNYKNGDLRHTLLMSNPFTKSVFTDPTFVGSETRIVCTHWKWPSDTRIPNFEKNGRK